MDGDEGDGSDDHIKEYGVKGEQNQNQNANANDGCNNSCFHGVVCLLFFTYAS
jgi:hypothetical protein